MCDVHTRTMFGTSPPYMHMEDGSIINGNHIQNVGLITFNVCLCT